MLQIRVAVILSGKASSSINEFGVIIRIIIMTGLNG